MRANLKLLPKLEWKSTQILELHTKLMVILLITKQQFLDESPSWMYIHVRG